jgi:hypothetical protein
MQGVVYIATLFLYLKSCITKQIHCIVLQIHLICRDRGAVKKE